MYTRSSLMQCWCRLATHYRYIERAICKLRPLHDLAEIENRPLDRCIARRALKLSILLHTFEIGQRSLNEKKRFCLESWNNRTVDRTGHLQVNSQWKFSPK